MHLFKTLLAAAVLIRSTNAAPFELKGETGWHGPGLYQIVNRSGGTAVDLVNGETEVGTPIYGRTLNYTDVQQIWLIARLKEGEYAFVNHASPTAIGATGAAKPVVAKAYKFTDLSIRWNMTLLADGYVIFESLMYPGNVLDLSYGSSKDMTPITSYPRHGQPSQQWRLDHWNPPDSELLDLPINVEL
ncbi:hypothetical protein GJ744_008462 [Endocarpon pusillum]|uniref:Ricin B lectin domain-containing protein n=1 Tax=Endocarpon pusillum TaxID=364733 RepID=A0A8H7E4H7_9EURO|nr:hypothetical protein GJ744_008462 [Endocarpon pusillum]